MLTRLVPTGRAEPFDPFSDAGLTQLLDAYEPPARDWLRLNFVASVTGSAAGPDGTSQTLTNRIDRRILGVIRAQADIALVGAQSVRTEGYRIPKTTTLGIVTSSGRLEGHRIEEPERGGPLVLCPAAAVSAVAASLPSAEIVTVPDRDGRLDPADVLAAVRDAGYRSIVCEGGPSLAGQFAAAGLVDEVCLSTAPLVTAAALPVLGGDAFDPVPVRLEQLHIDGDGALYARWVRASQSRMTDS